MPETRKGSLSEKGNNQLFTLDDIIKLINESRDLILKSMKDEIQSLNIKIGSFDSRIQSIETSLANFQTQYSQMANKITNIRHDFDNFKIQVFDDCANEIQQRTIRMNNAILFGVFEKEDGSVVDRKKWDEDQVRSVMMDVGVKDVNFSDVRRLGKKNGNRVRPLRVVIGDAEKRREFLRSSRRLRHSASNRRVFVKEDLTPLQQKRARLLQEELKTRRSNGEDVVIFREKVCLRKDIENFQMSILD